MELANDKELDQLLNEHFAGRVVPAGDVLCLG